MGKEPLGGRYITPLAQEKINRSTLLSRAAVFRGNGAGSAAHYLVGTGAWGTG